MYVDRGCRGQVAALAARLMSQPEGWGSGMRIESSVTSISWIPSEAIAGVTRLPFDLGVTHYDDPPPDEWKDLDAVVGPEGARFANNLRAWIEVEDGRIVAQGQGGG